jgi:natural product precursor
VFEKKIKKLSLNKESVRVLTSNEQATVNGGRRPLASGASHGCTCTCLCSKLTHC